MALEAGKLCSFEEVFAAADYDWETAAAVDYGDGVDRRRVKVAGLGFNDVSDVFIIPENLTSVDVTLDGDVVASVDVS